MTLYQDEAGRSIVTHSMLKTFRRCPKQTQYKFVERLKPRLQTSKGLTKGSWMHLLLEAYYKGEDWKVEHRKLSSGFAELFDEEKEALGDLPRECARLMVSYLWHYGANREDPFHGWKIHEVEMVIETELPNGALYRGRIDLLVEDEFGLWIVDHKNLKTLPDLGFRLRDAQSGLYIWAARREGIDVQGFIWNYLRTKAPTVPHYLEKSKRLSRRQIETDYPTLVRAIRDNELDPDDYRQQLRVLKNDRWAPGKTPTSPFFRRDVLEKSDEMLERVAMEAVHTAERMDAYDWNTTEAIERVVDRSCTFSCSYTELCTAELFAGEGSFLRKQRFTTGDPMDYYQDKVDSGAPVE